MIRETWARLRRPPLLPLLALLLCPARLFTQVTATPATGLPGSHHVYFVGVAGLIVGQAVLIVALLVSRARRRETEARNSAMLRALPDLMFVQTRSGVFVDFSAKDPAVLLAAPSQFLGKNMREILPPDLAERFFAAVERLFAGEEPVLVEYEVPIPSGDTRHFEARLVRCGSDEFLSIVRDVTDQRRATHALDRANAELLRASRMATLGEFAGSIAHELAQPLTAIMANSHACLRMLHRPIVDWNEVKEGLDDVLQSGKLAREVIHSTRHLFGKEDLVTTPLMVPDVVNEVCVMVHSTIRAKHISLDLRVEPDLPVVRADRVQLRQVILNLISNSIQAMDDIDAAHPHRLSIAAERDASGDAKLTVSDTGIGLAHVDRARLFSASYTTKPEGMGWGLSISRSIIEAHGGRLWAETDHGTGAEFSFTLPAERAPSAPIFGTGAEASPDRTLGRSQLT
jgi:PAS domain S-box-containing protein